MVIRYLTSEHLRKNTRTDQASHSSNNKAKFENTLRCLRIHVIITKTKKISSLYVIMRYIYMGEYDICKFLSLQITILSFNYPYKYIFSYAPLM